MPIRLSPKTYSYQQPWKQAAVRWQHEEFLPVSDKILACI